MIRDDDEIRSTLALEFLERRRLVGGEQPLLGAKQRLIGAKQRLMGVRHDRGRST